VKLHFARGSDVRRFVILVTELKRSHKPFENSIFPRIFFHQAPSFPLNRADHCQEFIHLGGGIKHLGDQVTPRSFSLPVIGIILIAHISPLSCADFSKAYTASSETTIGETLIFGEENPKLGVGNGKKLLPVYPGA
jgi:hypothetical protein